MKTFKDIIEGLRGPNYYYEWNLMNKSEDAAKLALKQNGFVSGGPIGYKNHTTKEMADIEKIGKEYKINIYDTHGKKLA